MSQYRKFIVAIVGGLVAVASRRYGWGNEVVQDLVALATAAGVYVAPNEPR